MAVVQKPLVPVAQVLNKMPTAPPKITKPEDTNKAARQSFPGENLFGGGIGNEQGQTVDAGNIAAQGLHVIPGAANGFLNLLAAIPIAVEKTGQWIMRGLGFHPSEVGMIEGAARAQSERNNAWADKYIPAPQSETAAYAAKVANVAGEAVPIIGTAIATAGGSLAASGGASILPNVLVGTPPSWIAGGVQAAGNELVQGSGDPMRAAVAGLSEGLASAIGGKTIGALSGKITNAGLSLGVDALGEGAEEVLSGVLQSAMTGDAYTLDQAVEEFALGATVGGLLGGAAKGMNAASAEVTKGRVQGDMNAAIEKAAQSDVQNVTEILSRSGDSQANAVIAQDSLTAIQKQTANPLYTSKATTAIPKDIAAKYDLVPVSEGAKGKPLVVQTNSYEGIVAPQVMKLSAPEVSMEARAAIDPGNATVNNPRALYQYAPDIYLRPGTTMDGTLFTYRGQANQFYNTSLNKGSIPASDVGKSWEGSGVYSALTPHTTDMYGPSGKLADNPYVNLGIKQKSVDVNYPIGVILQQGAGLSESVSPLTRHDAPADAVREGTRRIRYDDKNRGYITEVINNPADVAVTGLVFGRQGVAEAAPIQYAVTQVDAVSGRAASSVPENISLTTEAMGSAGAEADRLTALGARESVATGTGEVSGGILGPEEYATGEYIVPEVIPTSEVNAAIAHTAEAEQEPAISTYGVATNRTAHAPESAAEVTAESEKEALTEYNENHTVVAAGETQLESSSQETKTPAVEPPSAAETPPVKETSPAETVSAEVLGAMEVSPEEEAPTSSSIWTPIQTMVEETKRRREREDAPRYDFNIMHGQGFQGKIQETRGYKETFGGLSSY